jgi:hypothetical protein
MKLSEEMAGMELAENVIEESMIVYGVDCNCATVEVVVHVRDRKGRIWEGSKHVRVKMGNRHPQRSHPAHEL